MSKQLIVIGGGAAGFFCAVNAARMNPKLKVILLEKTGKLLSKVKVSGGGRCNITHACFDIQEMSHCYPRREHFVKKSFHWFFTKDTIQWFESRGVKMKTEPDGRMFPVTDSSQTVMECLLKEANRYHVDIMMNKEVKTISFQNNQWLVQHAGLTPIPADYICIASGGYPKSSMFDWLKTLGHEITDPVPSLFTFNLPGNTITKLMGISVENARVKIAGTKLMQEGPLLITHWGLSGPAILRLSAWGARELAAMKYDVRCMINWLPDWHEQTLREKFARLRNTLAAQKIINKNPFGLPARLWEFLADRSGIHHEKRWADLSAQEQNRFIINLCNYECEVKGKTTFKEEFVTAGGISLKDIDPNTMMSKKHPDLFFAGEVMDVDGITGGFNFQHAWTSGFIAAKTIAERSSG